MGTASASSLVKLPPEIQRALPPGVLVYAFDGEIIYHQTDNQTGLRVYSLLPVKKDARMYERRYPHDNKLQNTHLAIEQLHGHLGTVFYFFVPKPKSSAGQFLSGFKAGLTGNNSGNEPLYDTRSFAAMSLSSRQWLWVTDPRRARAIFEGEWRFVADGLKSGFNLKGLVNKMDTHAAIITEVVMHLRDEAERQAEGAAPSGRL